MFEDFIGQPIPWSEETDEWLGDIEPDYDYSGLESGGGTPF
ncbi:hypothetical protein [Vannielia sp.]|nr:hypothetical protein [Vannielia sp.]MDF1872339.1 hypothetical protein [Vannielia sp.]